MVRRDRRDRRDRSKRMKKQRKKQRRKKRENRELVFKCLQRLHQDIKLIRPQLDYVDNTGWHNERSLIVFHKNQTLEWEPPWTGLSVDNMSPFTSVPPIISTVPSYPEVESEVDTRSVICEWGKRTSNFRIKEIPPKHWGTIDIMNRLRSLTHPVVSSQLNNRRGPPHPEEEKWIYLDETCIEDLQDMVLSYSDHPYTPTSSEIEDSLAKKQKIILEDVMFVNDFLNDILSSGEHLSWSIGTFHHDSKVLSLPWEGTIPLTE